MDHGLGLVTLYMIAGLALGFLLGEIALGRRRRR